MPHQKVTAVLLRFLGEAGIYFPDRDAIRFTALSGGDALDCFVTRSALEVIGCSQSDRPAALIARFQQNRALIELAATVKYQRSPAGSVIALEAGDLQDLSQDLTRRLTPSRPGKTFDMEG
ncbi:DUF1488 family protein [Dongia sp.]|uniref:DUF1488 family protein n=1 Tax=Dongia sp. TaxID=1977262 RepID=UPI0037538E47